MRRIAGLALLLLPSLVAGLAFYVFTSGQVAPCLALDPAMNAACAEAWRADRTWFEQLLGTPIPGLLVAAVLAATTLGLRSLRRAG